MVHGGAGEVLRESLVRRQEGCLLAARRGGGILAGGGTALEAVCAAVEILEDEDVFNAGTGCALDREGGVSLDAAVMCGATRRAGAVALLPAFRHPIRIAARLLDQPVVLLAGEPAARWAEEQGFERLADEALIVPRSRKALEKALAEGASRNWAGGTVGAVARDARGGLAAATSTGGTLGKWPGRVGDSPVLGAGTYADPFCALSATGDGEAFLRQAFAARVAEALERGEEAAATLGRLLASLKTDYEGQGGAILVPRTGPPVARRNTATMAHAWWSPADEGSGD